MAASTGTVAPGQRFVYWAWVVKAARVDDLTLNVIGCLEGKISARSLNLTCAPLTALTPKPSALAGDVLP